MGGILRHHETQGFLYPDTSGQSADEDLIRRHPGGEQDIYNVAGVGEGKTSSCMCFLIFVKFIVLFYLALFYSSQ